MVLCTRNCPSQILGSVCLKITGKTEWLLVTKEIRLKGKNDENIKLNYHEEKGGERCCVKEFALE